MNGIEAQASTTYEQLDLALLRALLRTDTIGQGEHLRYIPVVTSTNTLAMDLAYHGSEEGVVVLTDSQIAGKGRQGKHWVDMAGRNAISSTILRPAFPPHQLVMIAALSVVAAIADSAGIVATIKWPNDILIAERKVAGILIETRSDRMGQLVAIIGIGVNVNGHFNNAIDDQSQDNTAQSIVIPDELVARAISLREACGKIVSRETLLAHLWYHLEIHYQALQAEALTTPTVNTPIARRVREQWRDNLSTLGRTVQVRQGDTILCGVAEDVNEHGELLLRCRSGERICVTWGDVG